MMTLGEMRARDMNDKLIVELEDLNDELSEERERADEMQRLVYVVWTAFAPHLPDVARQLQETEQYLADEFYGKEG